MRRALLLLTTLAATCAAGCEVEFTLSEGDVPRPQPAPTPRVVEVPVANLPVSLRVRNYKGGSCVHASTGSGFNWCNLLKLALHWNSAYSGGESYNGLTSKLKRNGIPFYDTASGDVSVLERATRERRMPTIFYYSNHSVSFCGFGDGAVRAGSRWGFVRNPQGKFAYLLDNNRTGAFIEIPRDEFIRRWRGYGGVAVVPTLGAPAPPLPFIARN
ncbi:MAG TPA: hypothetical protein VFV87_20480 [Pirellulaceae bacterium]|nr:hypothetical protein [Pirellulaceae bacterium]